MQADAEPTCGRPCDCDVVRIAAESRNVVANPAHRGPLIEQPEVARGRMVRVLGGKRGMREESERTETVAGGHDDGAGLLGHVLSARRREVRGPGEEAASMQPHDDRRRPWRGWIRGP